METQLKNDIKLSWGTPIVLVKPDGSKTVDDVFNAAIQHRAGATRVNVWRSDPDVLEWPIPEVETVKSWIVGAFQRMQERACDGATYEGRMNIRCWAHVVRPGAATPVEQHAHSAWTFLYRTGGELEAPDGDVHVVLQDPRSGAAPSPDPFHLFGQPRRLWFEPGQFMLFPSWVKHGVDAQRTLKPCAFLSGALATLDLM
jgi:hypothetical protein